MHIRASQADRVASCPGSIIHVTGEVLSSRDLGASHLGTAAHEALAAFVMGDTPNLDLDEIAERYDVDREELGQLYGTGTYAWNSQLEQEFTAPETEVALEAKVGSLRLTGHADVISVDGSYRWAIEVLDWESGRVRRGHRNQLRSYAYLALVRARKADQEPEKITVYTVWLRHREIDVSTYTPKQLDQWASDLADRVTSWNGVYTTGDHCAFCPKKTTCLAKLNEERALVQAFTGPEASGLSRLSPESVYDTYRRVKEIERAVKGALAQFKEHVESVGEVASGDRALVLAERGRTTIDARKAWPVLSEVLSQDELAEAVSISKTAITKAVRANAKGSKKAAVSDVLDQLEAAGAITKSSSQYLKDGKRGVKSE